ncbi:TlpA family protein disulfide reductase [Sphingobacterium phlebotomi]|uniref:TlpA family protein disulfide reductase n=1 Tax=Sphingobacterium phlebotomi TaxID=2605433 RepID=A0A5D4HAU3_9SPHI|nr:TlpA disulfide reductase family protein [Sphingobacterium phlebotomi]TYR37442.1 TlpA family protein disulfide reductase [Sphingobacterium phlebotomi]
MNYLMAWAAPNLRSNIPITRLSRILTICFMLFGAAKAQSQSVSARTASLDVTPLKIGSTIPEELWHLPLQVVNHPEGKDTITLNDYRDKKLIILDFWATWCASCIKNFPKINELQTEFIDEVKVLAITHEKRDIVERFFQRGSGKNHRYINSVLHDSIFKKLFPHHDIPHVVWLTSKGEVLDVTDAKEMTKENIAAILQDRNSKMVTKITLDREKPLFLSDYYGGNTELKTYSVFVKGQQRGLSSQSFYRIKDNAVKGRCNINSSLLSMYEFVAVHLFSKNGDRFDTKESIVIDVAEPEKVDFRIYEASHKKANVDVSEEEWQKHNLYSYDIILPLQNPRDLYPAILELINSATDYYAQIESRRIDGQDKKVFVIRDDVKATVKD